MGEVFDFFEERWWFLTGWSDCRIMKLSVSLQYECKEIVLCIDSGYKGLYP